MELNPAAVTSANVEALFSADAASPGSGLPPKIV
jgi:hypothetical protein